MPLLFFQIQLDQLLKLVDDADGFITKSGKFLTREEAGRAVSNKTAFERGMDLWDASELINRPVEAPKTKAMPIRTTMHGKGARK